MIVGVPSETFPGERRVALVPAALPILTQKGVEVLVQEGAGASAGFTDDAYRKGGARIVEERAGIFTSADVILQVRGLGANPNAGRADLEHLRTGQALICFLEPLTALREAQEIARTGVIAFAMELIPRVTRAQSMDALTSMATISGYKAVLLAAEALPRLFPMMITAAGTIAPARVLVVGAGVAGLQAIATARRLGAVVQAYDIRPAVKEEIESLGARYVDLPIDTRETGAEGGYAKAMDEDFYRRQRETLAHVVAQSDVVITTAAVPGKKAPVLVDGEMVKEMRPGSVIVDLAAERGGNCELTRPGETASVHGVSIIGHTNIPSTVPHDASQMYAKNIASFLVPMLDQGTLSLDLQDEVVRETLVTNGGQVVHPTVRELLGLPATTGDDQGKES
jgi:NAD(P) transhydrogenase subunit alpha